MHAVLGALGAITERDLIEFEQHRNNRRIGCRNSVLHCVASQKAVLECSAAIVTDRITGEVEC